MQFVIFTGKSLLNVHCTVCFLHMQLLMHLLQNSHAFFKHSQLVLSVHCAHANAHAYYHSKTHRSHSNLGHFSNTCVHTAKRVENQMIFHVILILGHFHCFSPRSRLIRDPLDDHLSYIGLKKN